MKCYKTFQNGCRLGSLGLAAAFILTSSSLGANKFVDDSAPSGGNGNSWPTAYNSFTTALNNVSNGEEIRVAQGTYKPGTLRTDTFQVGFTVKIFGGYIGYNAADPDVRNIELYPTILSGAIGTSADTDNSYHVVTMAIAGMDAFNTYLDGFTITKGYEDGGAIGGGAGILITSGAGPRIVDCKITANTSVNGYGGGVKSDSSDPVLIGCTIDDNEATDANYGGGVDVSGGSVKIISCTIRNNDAVRGAGIAVKSGGFAEVTNCLIVGNATHSYPSLPPGHSGGGINVDRNASVNVFNCTIVGNSSGSGGGYAQFDNTSSFVSVLQNNILWGNTASTGAQVYFASGGGDLKIDASNVQGGSSAIGPIAPTVYSADNQNSDPLFINTSAGNYRLSCPSPSIEAVNDSTALITNPNDTYDIDNSSTTSEFTPDRDRTYRVLVVRDQGAFEAHVIHSDCPADVHPPGGNGCVNIDDLLMIVNGWGRPGAADIGPSPAICGGEGHTDIDDLLMVINGWGEQSGPGCDCSVSAGESPLTVGDCWDTCQDEYPDDIDLWLECYRGCIDALCKQGLIECE